MFEAREEYSLPGAFATTDSSACERRMKQAILVTTILVAAAGILLWVGIIRAAIPVLKVGKLLRGEYPGGVVQVDGGTVKAIRSHTPLVFVLGGSEGPQSEVLVRSKQFAPENFREGVPVSIRGVYDPATATFEAYRVATQCPSRYRPAPAPPQPVPGAPGRGAP